MFPAQLSDFSSMMVISAILVQSYNEAILFCHHLNDIIYTQFISLCWLCLSVNKAITIATAGILAYISITR